MIFKILWKNLRPKKGPKNVQDNQTEHQEALYQNIMNEIQLEYSAELQKIHQTFIQKYGTPQNAYYPCCWQDASMIDLYPNLTMVDSFPWRKQKYEGTWFGNFHEQNVNTFSPAKSFDFVCILNPQVDYKVLTKDLQTNWYVLANNYHDTADHLRRDPNFIFIENLETNEEKFNPQSDKQLAKKMPFQPKDSWYFLFQKTQ